MSEKINKIIKLNLPSKKVVNFEYKGYSNLIDILEVDGDTELSIFEEITDKEYDEGVLIYLNFVQFKNKINNFYKNIRLWESSVNLIYELKNTVDIVDSLDVNLILENPFLKWLDLDFTESEQKFIEVIEKYVKNFDLYGIKANLHELEKQLIIDHPLIYFIKDCTLQYKFTIACGHSHMKTVEFLYNTGKINIRDNFDYPFLIVASNGDLDLMKWLYLKSEQKIGIEKGFFGVVYVACIVDKIEIIEWFFSIKPLEIQNFNFRKYFSYACRCGRMEIIEYFDKIANPEINLETLEDGFLFAMDKNEEKVMQWIFNKIKSNYIKNTEKKLEDDLEDFEEGNVNILDSIETISTEPNELQKFKDFLENILKSNTTKKYSLIEKFIDML